MNKRKILGIFLVVSLILLVFIAGFTYAKYFTQVDGAGSAQVAKWSFVANAGEDEITNIKLRDTVQQTSLVDGKIAPGTGGFFDIVIDGSGSEVDINYSIEVVSENNIPSNLKFALDDGDFIYVSLSDLVNNELLNGRINYDGEQIIKHSIYWEWPYESGDDAIDTQDGESALEYSFGLRITGVQAQTLIP